MGSAAVELPRDAYEIREAITQPGAIRSDGLVALHIIRPGLGRGKGRHVYEADMLQREVNAGRFKDWKMYLDHQAPQAKKAAGGLPRSLRDLGGYIKEAWWDANVPADARHGKGAVVGLAKPTRFVRSLIEDIPEAIGASVAAMATSVRPVMYEGQTALLVEGIQERGSVDWVTEPGAGGRVVNLMHALQESLTEEEDDLEMFEALTDDEVLTHLSESRPDLLVRISEAEDDGDEGERERLVNKHMKKLKSRKMAEKAADQEMKEGHVTVDELREALGSEEFEELIEGRVESAVKSAFAEMLVPKMAELFEAGFEQEREYEHEVREAASSRQMQLRDLRDTAHRMIAESKLPEPFQRELRDDYTLSENGKPTAGLDVEDEEDEDGKVTAAAEEKLREAVERKIKTKREQVAALRPTVVRTVGDSGEGGGKAVQESDAKKTTGSPLTDALLQEASIEPGDDLYAGILN